MCRNIINFFVEIKTGFSGIKTKSKRKNGRRIKGEWNMENGKGKNRRLRFLVKIKKNSFSKDYISTSALFQSNPPLL
jgi:hypothetical protein